MHLSRAPLGLAALGVCSPRWSLAGHSNGAAPPKRAASFVS
jgi:hypothetical protein